MSEHETRRPTYNFHVTTQDPGGDRTTQRHIYWRGLSLVQARNMYAWTTAHMPDNVVAYGWGEEDK